MNPQNLLIESWLQAAADLPRPPGCLTDEILEGLARHELTAKEARSATLHLTQCAPCRRVVARLAAQSAVPARPVALRELLAQGDVGIAWRDWIQGLVCRLPVETETRPAGANHDTVAARIDTRGRLIVEAVYATPPREGSRARLTLTDAGRELEVCEAVIRQGRLYAVVDLSAFSPRPGVLRDEVLSLEAVKADYRQPTPLMQLEQWRRERLRGVEFWDRFTALSEAHPNQLANSLLADIEPDAERTTRGARVRAASEVTEIRREGSWETTLAYARATLKEFARTWQESNGAELPQARQALELLEQVTQRASGATVSAPRARKAEPESSEATISQARLAPALEDSSERTVIQPARPQTEAEQTLVRRSTPRAKPEGGG